MRKILFALIPCLMMGVATTFVGCDKAKQVANIVASDSELNAENIQGEWTIENIDVFDMDEDDLPEGTKIDAELKFDGSKMEICMNFKMKDVEEVIEKMDMTIVLSKRYSLVDDALKLKSGGKAKGKVNKLKYYGEVADAMEEAGMDLDEVKEQVEESMSEELESSLDDGFTDRDEWTITKFDGQSMTIDVGDGEILHLTRK